MKKVRQDEPQRCDGCGVEDGCRCPSLRYPTFRERDEENERG